MEERFIQHVCILKAFQFNTVQWGVKSSVYYTTVTWDGNLATVNNLLSRKASNYCLHPSNHKP